MPLLQCIRLLIKNNEFPEEIFDDACVGTQGGCHGWQATQHKSDNKTLDLDK